MIELNQLEQLIYIAENKTISKAAKELLISQPALSRSMQRLESDLGVELFDHYKNKIVLNKNGELAVKHAQKIIKSIQTMINDVQDYDQSFHRISIATCSPAPMWDIEPLIKELYPQITIQTAVINQKDLITNNIWGIVIDNSGNVIWQYNLPEEIPLKYSLQDVATFSKGYIKRKHPLFFLLCWYQM